MQALSAGGATTPAVGNQGAERHRTAIAGKGPSKATLLRVAKPIADVDEAPRPSLAVRGRQPARLTRAPQPLPAPDAEPSTAP